MKEKITPYFVLSFPCGIFKARGYLKDLPENIVELLDANYLCTLWDIEDSDPDKLVHELLIGEHPSFAFNESFDELCLGDYV